MFDKDGSSCFLVYLALCAFFGHSDYRKIEQKERTYRVLGEQKREINKKEGWQITSSNMVFGKKAQIRRKRF